MNKLYASLGLLLLIGSSISGYAQISDSLYKALPDTLKPKNKVRLSIQERQRILKATPDILSTTTAAGLQLLANTLDIDIKTAGDKKDRSEILHILGTYFSATGNQDKAIAYYRKSITEIGDNANYGNTLAWCYSDMAVSYYYKGKKDSLVDCLQTSLSIEGADKDSTLLLQNYNIYSVVYFELNLYEKAAYYARLAINNSPSAGKWNKSYTDATMQAAIIYASNFANTKKLVYSDSAILFFNQIIAAKKKDAADWYMACYMQLSLVYYYLDEYQTSVRMADSASLPIYNQSSKVYPNYYYGAYFYKAISLIKLGRYEQGKQILDTLKITEPSYKYMMYRQLYLHAEKVGNWKDAHEYYKKSIEAWTTLDLKTQSGKLFETEQKYSVAKKEALIAKLENNSILQKQEKNNIVTVALLCLLLLTIIILVLYLNNKAIQTKRRKEREALTDSLHKLEEETNLQQAQAAANNAMAMANQRKDISKNLHDELSGSIATLRYYVADLKQNSTDEDTRAMLNDIEQEAHQVYMQARSFMHGLHNTGLAAQYNVVDFLNSLTQRFGEGSGLHIHALADNTEITRYFTPLHHNELYRIIKESVVNSMKHSAASRLDITLQFINGIFHFTIADNGKGIAGDNGGGMGMTNLQERMALLKGSLNVSSSNKGTVLSGKFPV